MYRYCQFGLVQSVNITKCFTKKKRYIMIIILSCVICAFLIALLLFLKNRYNVIFIINYNVTEAMI